MFDFRMGRGREGPKEFLGKFEGILQTDGYLAYERVGGPKMVHVGCWAHARRKFVDALKLNPGDLVATPIVWQWTICSRSMPRRASGISTTPRATPCGGAGPAVAGLLKRAWRRRRRPAFQRAGQGGPLHPRAVAQTHALPGTPGGGVEQQPGGELDAPVALGRKNWIHVGSRRPDRKWRPSFRSSRPATALRFRFGIIWPLSCPASPTSPFSVLRNSRRWPGPLGTGSPPATLRPGWVALTDTLHRFLAGSRQLVLADQAGTAASSPLAWCRPVTRRLKNLQGGCARQNSELLGSNSSTFIFLLSMVIDALHPGQELQSVISLFA